MRRSVIFLSLVPILIIIFVFVIPYGIALHLAFLPANSETGNINFAYTASVTIWTVKQAFLSTCLALVLGLPGAWIISAKRDRFCLMLRSLCAIPFAMPSILVILSFVIFFGASGTFNGIVKTVFNTGIPFLYKPYTIIFAHAFYNFPVIMRLAGDSFYENRKIYSAVSASLGASDFKTALTVILPLSLPVIGSAVLLVFLYCFTSFALVLVLGGGPASSTLAVEIYRFASLGLDYKNAGVLALLETIICAFVFCVYLLLQKKDRISDSVMGDITRRPLAVKKQKKPAEIIFFAVYSVIVVILILCPLLSVPVQSFFSRASMGAKSVFSFYAFENLQEVFLPLCRSLLLTFFSASFVCVMAVMAASFLCETYSKNQCKKLPLIFIKKIMRIVIAAPLVSSGIVLGLGYLVLFGNSLYEFSVQNFILLILLHSVLALPFAFNSVYSGFSKIPSNIRNSAAILGCSPLKRIMTIEVPLSAAYLRSAWGFSAALSLGEMNVVMMLSGGRWETLPLYIYRAVSSYRFPQACAAGTILLFCTLFVLMISDLKKGDTCYYEN
ncbi:MAG: iron ABC transporter permease [Spirochaetaceae bacterium]|jgi:thiamine transport system permease protein|nr:iron ABC transporter permease [Spirochaetaceae bacterium]